MKKISLFLIVALVLSGTFQSCVTLGTWSLTADYPPSTNRPEHWNLGNLRNNTSLKLDSGVYKGDITIRENRVTLLGEGTARTLIDGNIHITGNNCTLGNLRVQGDVYLSGNNADLRSAVIEGKVSSSGNHNRW